MTLKARLAVSFAALAVAAYAVGPVPHGAVPVAASGVVTYTFDKNPIAAAGSLAAGATVNVTLTVTDQSGPVPGASVFLSFLQGGGSGSAATSPSSVAVTQCGLSNLTLSSTSVACTADNAGTITMTYQAAMETTGPPAVPVTGGHDTIVAGTTSSSKDASTEYAYSTVASYAVGPTPIADVAALAADTSQHAITVTALDAHGATVTTLPNGATPQLWVTLSGSPAATALLYAPSAGTCTGTTPMTSFPQSLATTAGVATVCFRPPSAVGEVDTVTFDDTKSAPADVTASDGYNNTSLTGATMALIASPSPIASAGSLAAGTHVPVTYKVQLTPTAGSPAGLQWARVTLDLQKAPGGGTAFGSAKVGGVDVTSSAQDFATDANGLVSIDYVAGSSSTKADELSGTTPDGSNPSITTTDFYTYAQVTHYVFSVPTPIAPDASLGLDYTTPVVVTAEDASNNGVPNALVKVTFNPAKGDSKTGPSKLQFGSAPTQIDNTGTTFTTDSNGATATMTYLDTTTASAANLPLGGQDVITASAPDGSNAAVDYYKFDTLTSYTPSPSPIAPLGTLGPNGTRNISILQKDGSTADNSTPMWLTFTAAPGGGTATVSHCVDASNTAVSSLSTTPAECTPDISGTVQVLYSAPSTLPSGGGDILSIADDSSSPAVTGTDSYTFVGHYVFSPSPIAATGALAPGSTTPITVTVEDAQGHAAPGGAVALKMTEPSGGGTATAQGHVLTPTALMFNADNIGQVAISYVVANPPAPGGVDTITAQNAVNSPSVSSSDSYGYVSSYSFSPAAPIAPAASLGANSLRQFVITTRDSHGAAAPHALAYLSFTQASGGGGASVNGTSLTSTPHQFISDGSGNITVDYTTPGTLPSSGVDTVTVGNAASSPSLTASNSYSFQPMPTMGYWLVASDGGIFAHGKAQFYGSTGAITLNKPIVGMAATPSGKGYWLVASDGGIFAYGDAAFHGSTGAMTLNKPVVGMASTPSGNGYWLVASDGGIFSYGDAHFYGSTGAMHLNQPIVGMAATPSGHGYWLVASDGGIFAYGDAAFHGSTGAMTLNKPVVGMASTPSGNGYWLVASDGGIFAYGDAVFHGSTGNMTLNKPIVGMAASPDGAGYWFVASDGGIFAEGDAAFEGSEGATALNKPIVGMASAG